MCRELGEFIDVVPPQQRIDEHWYQGTADAVYQNIYTLEKERPRYVVILAGDHIYKMNYGTLVEFHRRTQCRLDDRRPAGQCRGGPPFRRDADRRRRPRRRVRGKAAECPSTIPGDPRHCLASMGIYVFNARFLVRADCASMRRGRAAQHDFGHNIIPSMIDSHRVFAFPFRDENRKQDAYWRNVGTLDAYFEANMDLISVDPLLNMYDERWPIRTYQPNLPPPKFVFAEEGPEARRGQALDSIVCQGSHYFRRPRGTVDPRAQCADQQLCPRRRFDLVRRASISAGMPASAGRSSTRECTSRPGIEIGFDPEQDRPRVHRQRGGITVIAKADVIEHSRVAEAAEW